MVVCVNLILGVLACVLSFLCSIPGASAGNLIKNPGFEEGNTVCGT